MTDALSRSDPAPVVSVIMAFHDAGQYLEDAIASVLAQSLHSLELILVDDASTDASLSRAQRAAARDPRVRVLTSDTRGGPAQARNRALDNARGDWIAIVDADDLLHPGRIERLIARAKDLSVDMVADDLICFGSENGISLLHRLALRRPWLPEAADLLRAETSLPLVPVGYLKPVIRRHALGSLRYRPYLSIGEDFDLLLRLRLSGARLAVLPDAYYLYRRHAASISHRISEDAARSMLRAMDELEGSTQDLPATMTALLAQRRTALTKTARFARLVKLMKDRSFAGALGALVRHPALARPLMTSIYEHLNRQPPSDPRSDAGAWFMLMSDDAAQAPNGEFVPIAVPSAPSKWTTSRATAVSAMAGAGNARIRAVDRAGLEALGYVPGWLEVELIAPPDQWSDQERRLIAALPWPVREVSVAESSH